MPVTEQSEQQIRTPFEVGNPVRYTGDFVRDPNVLPTYVVAEIASDGVVTMTLPDGSESRDIYFTEIEHAGQAA
jgi:hypothetical protein